MYVRRFKTDAELAAFRSEMARNRTNRKGGRPKKSAADGKPSSKTMTVREEDYIVFKKCAHIASVPLIDFLHLNAESLKKRNPQIFGESTPTVEA